MQDINEHMIKFSYFVNWTSCFRVVFETFLYMNLFVNIPLYTSAAKRQVVSGIFYKLYKFFPKFFPNFFSPIKAFFTNLLAWATLNKCQLHFHEESVSILLPKTIKLQNVTVVNYEFISSVTRSAYKHIT